MDYFTAAIESSPEGLDTLCAELSAMGLDCFQIEDERDLIERSPYWEMAEESIFEHYHGACRVIIYLPVTPEGQETLAALRSRWQNIHQGYVSEEQWRDCWKQYYKPFLIGERLAVHPQWEPMGNYKGRAVYISNPGMSFGTGLHASTRLCLQALESMELTGKRILDLGCGSGILGLCALLLGAESVTAVDIDPLAADVTRDNAKLNGLSVTAYAGNILTDNSLRTAVGKGYDIVCTNIVADVIIALAEYVPAVLKPGGVWLSSGIIDTRTQDVLDALPGAVIAGEENGWVAVRL